ncbi:MAG: extracellular solute-binding protein [Cellulosilyticum sp.]|nr:extracellular solute-binding protein [Cellulosilyticum sp.]
MKGKIIQSAIAGIGFSMALVGCGAIEKENMISETADNTKEVVELRLWATEEDEALIDDLIEGFKEEHSDEAIINVTFEAQGEDGCKYRILTNVNETPDVFTFADDQLTALAAAGVLRPIANQESVKTNNLEGAVNAVTINEQLYAYPLTADNGYFMYYNSDYFTEADVQSLDKMLEIAQKHNKKISMDWTSGWYLYSFFGNTGLTLGLSEDGITNYCTWNEATGAIKGADIVEVMYRIGKSPAFVSTQGTDFIKGIQEGNIIATISGIWDANIISEAWGDAYAATKLPTYTCQGQQIQMASFAGYKMVGVNSYSENVEWAEKLAEYLTNEASQTKRFEQRGQGPSNINAAASEEVNNSIANSALIKQSEFSSLQRVGENYWAPATAYGTALASGNLNGLNYQQLIDQTVEGITMQLVEDR